jgi:hypothetical protein
VVARTAATAAVVALARGQTAFAARMADAALRHPALEFETRAGVEAVWAALGSEAPATLAFARAAIPAADLLDEVEAWLAQ